MFQNVQKLHIVTSTFAYGLAIYLRFTLLIIDAVNVRLFQRNNQAS